jgi:hypothetical protein
VGGQCHTLANLSSGRSPGTHLITGWVDLRVWRV